MAAPTSPGAEHGYIRTVLGQQGFMDLDSSTLALPSDERLQHSGRHDGDRSQRIRQQVQLTMARRKCRSGSLSSGHFQRSTSVPEHVYTQNYVEKDSRTFLSQGMHSYISMKEYNLHGSGNGWAGGPSVHSSYRTMEDKSQAQPLRREISPERCPTAAGNGYRDTLSPSQRFQESRKAAATAPRYARSDVAGQNMHQWQQSTFKKQVHVGTLRNPVYMVGSLPSSPTGLLYQMSGNSRSMNNLIDKEYYSSGTAAVGQTGTMVQTTVVPSSQQYVRSNWNQSTFRSMHAGQGTSQQASMASGATDPGVKRTIITAVTGAATGSGILGQNKEAVQTGSQVGGSEVDMTLERAVHLLDNESSSSYWITTAANYIQHESFQKAESRRKVYSLGGIPKLLQLLNNENEDVQRAACAALRNLVFEDNDNKLEVCEHRGIPVLLRLLKQTRDLETKKQITGLLWNLSSNDQLKSMLIRDALQTVNENIVIPYSGWPEGDYPKIDALSDPDIFYNTTGCLRNMSSAGPEGRKQMRECDGLIDSLVHYVRGTVADYKPDDKSTENCVCILHNLSYQLETELPSSYAENIYIHRRDASENTTNLGCFGGRSGKIKEQEADTPLPEEKSNPKGVEWLWHSIVMRMYLSLIAKSSRSYTQEASLGALQNLTAGSGPMPFAVAQMIVQKENGLQHIRNILHSTNPSVRRTTVSMLRNLSRNISLQNEIAKNVLPDLVTLLPESAPESNIANETAASTCYTINNLIQNSSQNARALLDSGGLRKLFRLSSSENTNLSTKAGKAASVVLYSMWNHSDLHGAYKKAQFKKTDFVNSRTAKAYNSLKD
ncbi:plakophilin-2 [Ambystoma mexicanum]|uniref:plakophilin-2 n=1 Tax=Ambystoma mexicanum TaxID=8296 RepID=UPI0037E80CF2